MIHWLLTTYPVLTWLELIGLILGIIGIIGLPIVTYMHHLYEQNQLLSQVKQSLTHLLEAMPESRCWWNESSTRIQCSHSFAAMLKLNPDHPVETVDLINQFDDASSAQLNHILQHICQTGESFSRQLTLVDQKTLVHIHGIRIVQSPQNLFVLSARNVTQSVHENRRHQAEIQTLRKEHEMLQAMVDIVPVALWCRNSQNQIVFCNVAYAGAVESTPSQVALDHREIIEKTRSTSPWHLAVKVRESGQSQSQRGHVVIDGFRRLIEMTEVLHTHSNHGMTVGYALDITDNEEIASSLNKHVLAHQEVLHQLSTPIAVFGADTRLEFFNSAYRKLFGFEETWLHAKPSFGDVLQNLRERRKLPEYPDFQAFKAGQLQLFKTLLFPLQELINLPDDQILRLLIAPHPLGGLLFMYDDVTDKLALERRYNTLIAVQKETLDHLYEGIVVLGSDSRLRLSNPAAANIWQVDKPDVTPGKHITELLALIRTFFTTEEDWQGFQDNFLNIINRRVPKSGRFNRADASMIQYAYVPLPDGSHLVSFIDVSDRCRVEEALQERNQALEEADRIKSAFLSHVSYELRAPLNMVIGFAEILVNQYFGPLNDQQSGYCEGMIDSAQRLLGLINDILDMATIEAGQMTLIRQQINLENFLSSVVGLVYNRSLDQRMTILQENRSQIKTFVGDERRLKQAIFNLLSNAIKYTPAGGQIYLKASTHQDNLDTNLCLSVQDTGIGITEENRARIFKIFERVPGKSRPAGAGLGLSLVKSLVELHGGTISIDSLPGQGTTISCIIPVMKEDDVITEQAF